MRYMIAADAGGTKMDTILFNDRGDILLRDISLGCNPLDLGMETARARAFEVLRRVISRSPGRVSAVYAAIAGTYYFEEPILTPEQCARLEADSVRLDDDGRSMISSTLTRGEDGCSMVCGTGCSVWVRRGDGPLIHLGGWGYLIDTLGSGFILGQEAFRAVCKAADGRGEQTALTGLVGKDLGEENPRHAMPILYAGGRRRIAALAHTVFEGARQGDRVSLEILERGVENMAQLIWAADRYFDGPYPVVMGGGIVTSFPEYGQAIRRRAPERAELILSQAPPVFGGAVEAMADCGLTCDGEFRARFLAGYREKGQ